MAATGRSRGDLAATLTDAPFVRVAPRANGDAVAAAGLLLGTLDARSTPYRARVVAPTDEPPAEDEREGERVTLPIGFDGGLGADGPASLAAIDLADDLGGDPDVTLALAGCHAAGVPPGTVDLAADLDRREGVGIPTADVADGLAHSTLVHAGFSGGKDAVGAALDDIKERDGRAVASLLALEVAGADGATPRAAERVERALRPHATPEGPFETVEGHADVLDCLAREAPGLALALATGHDVRGEALDAWRTHAAAAHRALREGTTGRYDGLFVARTEEAPVPVGTAARLLCDFRSPEPVALVVSDGKAAATRAEGAASGDLARTMAEAAAAVGGAGGGTARHGVATYDGEARAFIAAVREAMP